MNETKRFANKISYPVVLKIASDKLLHKTDIHAVRVNVTKDQIEKVFKDLNKIKIEKQGILVQKFKQGKQILIGLKKDQTFGHIIVVGVGVIFTEVIKDTSFRIAPINKNQAKKMLKELKAYPILTGVRGGKIKIDAITKVILKVSALSKKCPTIKELDINPLVVDENKARIVDARIIFD